MSYRTDEIFDDLKKGRISETEAEWDLRRIESSSCMRSRIDNIVRDTVFGRYDPYEASREFMLQYMQDITGVDLDCVINFMQKTTDKQRLSWLQNQ
jgi:hypothetical protein